jgi:hypothetical protein
MSDKPEKWIKRTDGVHLMGPYIRVINPAYVDALGRKVEAMQHVVNCASAFASTDDADPDTDEDQDYMEQLFEAVRDYRAAIDAAMGAKPAP